MAVCGVKMLKNRVLSFPCGCIALPDNLVFLDELALLESDFVDSMLLESRFLDTSLCSV